MLLNPDYRAQVRQGWPAAGLLLPYHWPAPALPLRSSCRLAQTHAGPARAPMLARAAGAVALCQPRDRRGGERAGPCCGARLPQQHRHGWGRSTRSGACRAPAAPRIGGEPGVWLAGAGFIALRGKPHPSRAHTQPLPCSVPPGYFQRLRPYPRVLLRRLSARFKDYDKTPIGFGIAVFCIAREGARWVRWLLSGVLRCGCAASAAALWLRCLLQLLLAAALLWRPCWLVGRGQGPPCRMACAALRGRSARPTAPCTCPALPSPQPPLPALLRCL